MQIKPKPPLIVNVKLQFFFVQAQQRKQHQENNQAEVVKRKNSQNPFSVKISEIVCGVKGVKQNGGDEITGQNKKKVYAQPREKKMINKVKIVVQKNKHNGKTSQSIQCRVVLLLVSNFSHAV